MARSALSIALSLAAACSAPLPATDAEPDGARDAGATDAFVVPRPRAAPLACVPGAGTPRDLVPLARLEAGPTRIRSGSVREDRDGPAAMRDDDPATGWAPLAATLATLRIDLDPAIERPVALDTVTIAATGAPIADAHVYVLEACGGGVVADFAWPDPTTALSLAGTCGACVEIDLRGGTTTVVDSAILTSRDDTVVLPAALPTAPATPPVAARLESGVIEGFYGPPWSFAERARTIDAMSTLGLGTYLYAPKDDPLHRAEWRTPYDAAAVARFAALADVAHARGVRFFFGVSPFLDFDPALDADHAALATKLGALLDAGADGIAILADDLFAGASPDAALAAVQVDAVTRALDALSSTHPGVPLWFVPTVYEDHTLAREPGGAAYLMGLRALPTEVRILWTGTSVGSATLGGADLANVRSLIGRDPLLWENEWANDIADMVHGHLLLGTYEGRDDALRTSTVGIGSNPLVQGSLARLTVGMLAAWIDRSETGDAARASAADLEARFLWRAEPGARDVLVRMLAIHDGTFAVEPTHRALEAALDRIVLAAATGAPDPADLALALDVLGGMAALASDAYHRPFDVDLADELAPPLASLAEDGLAGLALLDALTARLGGREAAAEGDAVRAHHAAATRASRYRWQDGLLVGALVDLEATPVADRGLRAPSATGTPDPSCLVGQTLTIDAFADGSVHAYGLPDATVSGTRVTFTPPHGGRYRAIVTAASASGGVASRVVDLVCVPAR